MSEMNDTLRELERSLEQATQSLNSWGSVLQSGAKYQNALNNSIRNEIKQDEEDKKSMEKWANGVQKATSEIISFGKTFSSNAGSFAPLGDLVVKTADGFSSLVSYIPVIGKAFGTISKAGAEVANYMIKSYETAYSTFERVSQSGVVDSFTTFEKSAAAMGLTFSDFERVVAKNSKDVALLGGGALRGAKMLEMLGAGSEQLRNEFQKLGISTAEGNELQLSYLFQQQQINRGRVKMTQQTIEATGAYVRELDLLSKLSGQTRKALDEGRRARMNDARFRAGIAMDPNVGPNLLRNINTVLDLIGSKNEDTAKALSDIIAANGAATTEGARVLSNVVKMGGGDLPTMARQLKSGELDMVQFMNVFVKAYHTGAMEMQKASAVAADVRSEFSQIVGADDMMKSFGNLTHEMIQEEMKRIETQTKESDTLNATMAETKQNLYRTGQRLEKLSVSSDIVAGAMGTLSDYLNTIVREAYDIAGIEVPSHVRAQFKFQDAEKELTKFETNVVKTEAEIKKLTEPSTTDESLSSKVQNIQNQHLANTLSNSLKNKDSKLQDLETKRDNAKSVMIQEQNKALGSTTPTPTISTKTGQSESQNVSPVDPTESSSKETKSGWKSFFTDPGETLKQTFGRMITPSSTQSQSSSLRDNYLKSLEQQNAVPKMATGGILSGPKSEYLTDLHNDESVVQNTVSKQALNSTISTMTTPGSKNNLTEMYESVSDKMDQLVKLMKDQSFTQKKMMESKLD